MSEIQITLPDETVKQVEQGSTSGDIARSIGEGLFRASIAAKVNGDIVDLESPIEKNTNVEILTNKNPEAHEILLHSSAHLLAQAVKELYPKAKIAIGPALSDRYYYDIDVEVSINEEELEKIEQKMKTLAKQNLQVERVELSRNDALEKFKKLEKITKSNSFQKLMKTKLFLPINKVTLLIYAGDLMCHLQGK